MGCVKTCFFLLVVSTFVDCGRYGGGFSDSEIASTVSPDNNWKPPKLQALAYRSGTTARSRTTARKTHPPTTPRPARTSLRPAVTTPRPVRTTRRPSTTPRLTWTTRTTPRPTRTTPRPTWTTGTTRRLTFTTPRPTWTTRTTPRPTRTTPRPTWTTKRTTRPTWTTPRLTFTTPRPTWTTKKTTRPTWTTPRPTWTTKRTTRPTWTTRPTQPLHKNEISWDDLPPRPGSKIKYGKTKIKIVNTYNYNYPGYYSMPVPNQHHPGYYQTYSTYRYTSSDTGSGILGFYLGYKLAKLTTPTYSHYTFYDGYRPRYDHYTVHHYYHNADAVPKRQEIVSEKIVGCVGDSTSVCPANTTSLCTADGRLMCVVVVTSLVGCKDANDRVVNCTSTTVSCVNNTAPECAGGNKTTVVVNIPCLSSAKVYGSIEFVNNTIVQSHAKYVNSTEQISVMKYFNNTEGISNSTDSTTMTYVNNTEDIFGPMKYINNTDGTTEYPLTTPFPTPTTSVYWKWKRSVQTSQEFCVTIVAQPAPRIPTKGEEFLDDATDIFEKFIEAAWNL